MWTDSTLPFKLNRDDFSSYVDQNSHRIPAHALQPLVAAVLHEHGADYSFADLDIVLLGMVMVAVAEGSHL